MTERNRTNHYHTLDEVFPIGKRFPVGQLGFWNLMEISVLLYGHLKQRNGFGGAVLLSPPADFDETLAAYVEKKVFRKRQQRVRVRGEEANYWVLRVPRHFFGRLDMEFTSGPRLVAAMNQHGEIALASCYSVQRVYSGAWWIFALDAVLITLFFLLFLVLFFTFALNAVNSSWVPRMQPADVEQYYSLFGLLLFTLMFAAPLYRHLDAIHARVFRKEEIWERRLPRVTEEMHRMKDELVALGWRLVPEEEWDDYLLADESAEEDADAAQG